MRNQIVIRLKNRDLKKGYTDDFMPNKDTFHLNNRDGKTEEINVEDAKAIFFVKDLDGNKGYKYKYEDVISGAGKKINIDFLDGEKIIGYVLVYSPERKGFFVKPADLNGNNRQIYVVASSLKKIEIIYSDEK
ncbi:MAG: hypothetical protein JXL81_02060 [Deltaproteobacteria bacterium]|nr:hypothetical protein [Deltaproteobacteria bacterium]